MIKIKKTLPNGYYLFQGKASANSCFIEDLTEAKRFIILANSYFKGYLKIHEYLITQDGWNFIVKINSLESIRKRLSIKEDEKFTVDSVWRVISERMRIFLSTFVRFTNNKQGRTGGKVHSSYERFLFESLKEAKEYIEKMRKGIIQLFQRKRKYRAQKSHYKIPLRLGRGSIFLSSYKLRERIRKCKERLEVLEKLATPSFVLRKLIDSTLEFTPRLNSPHFFFKT